MPSWNELVDAIDALPPAQRIPTIVAQLNAALGAIGGLRNGRNVVLYASPFLQKPNVSPRLLQISREDLNAFMSVVNGMDCSKGLTLVLHTPGGDPTAAETIVEYLRSKFPTDFEVAIPTYAMSAGTMISLAADRVLMGRQSQLGPIDPQMVRDNKVFSATAVVEQFKMAKLEIVGDPANNIPGNKDLAHAWAPILQSMGPSLLQEALNALQYGEDMVERWLATYMLRGLGPAAAAKADAIAKHFNDATHHKSHGRRIGRDEAKSQGVVVEDLEPNQALQDAVLTAYHLFTILVEKSLICKVIANDQGRYYLKTEAPAQQGQQHAPSPPQGGAPPPPSGSPPAPTSPPPAGPTSA